jgi:hypothetical protein
MGKKVTKGKQELEVGSSGRMLDCQVQSLSSNTNATLTNKRISCKLTISAII